MISIMYGLFSGFFSRHLKRICSFHVISFAMFDNKEIFIFIWSRTPKWSHWDSLTSWRVGRESAVDSGRSERARESDACPQTVLCRRPALSPWCRSPIRRLGCRIHCRLRYLCCQPFPALSRTVSLCRCAFSRVRSSLFSRVQNPLISLRLPSLERYCCHGCLCELRCARASGLKPEKEAHNISF